MQEMDAPRTKGLFVKLTMGIVKTLQKRQGVCDIKLIDRTAAEKHAILAWEQKWCCLMPEDMKNFYLTTDGLLLKWSVRMNDTHMPVGRMEVNSLSTLVRIAGVGGPNANVTTLSDVDVESDEEDTSGHSLPRFDHRSRIFELDACEGFGKACLVYLDTKPGIPAQKPEVWFLDRALQWHPLAATFTGYYRLMLMHLGLPQWQYAFTDIGVSPQAKQWFHMYAPVRLELDDCGLDFEATYDEVSLPTNTNQLDIARVFKGKTDKNKKTGGATNQPAKKKPPTSSAKGPGPPGSRGSGSSSQLNKTTK